MNELTTAIRRNNWASWTFALGMGIVYRYLYGRTKDGIWLNRKLDFLTEMVDPSSEFQTITLVTSLNAFVELSSSIIPAVICGIFLTYVFRNKAMLFSVGAVASFLLLSSRIWRYWSEPYTPLYLKIIGSASPIIAALVLIAVVLLILKIKGHITTRSPRRGLNLG